MSKENPFQIGDAFSLRVVGNSMDPRYKHGELIIVCPNMPCSQGNYVYVALHDGRKLVKQLGKDHGDAYDFLSVNQEHKTLTIEKEKIAGMYRVSAGTGETLPRSGCATIEVGGGAA